MILILTDAFWQEIKAGQHPQIKIDIQKAQLEKICRDKLTQTREKYHASQAKKIAQQTSSRRTNRRGNVRFTSVCKLPC
jgi:hypothetical protein